MAYDPFAALMAMNPKKEMADEAAAEAMAKITKAEAAKKATMAAGAKAFAKFLSEARGVTPTDSPLSLSQYKPEDTAGVYVVKEPGSGFSLAKIKQPDGTNLIVLENIKSGLVTNLTGFTSIKFSDGNSVDLAAFAEKAGEGDLRAFNGGAGADIVTGREGIADVLLGNAGDDEFSDFSNLDVIDGGEGTDVISLDLPANYYSVVAKPDAAGNITYAIAWFTTGADGQQQAVSMAVSNVESVRFASGGGTDGKAPVVMKMADFAAQRAYTRQAQE